MNSILSAFRIFRRAMSNSGRLILPSEFMSISFTKSSISHGGKFAISAARNAFANSTISMVPELSTSAHSKNSAVVVPLPHSHLVSLTKSSSNTGPRSSSCSSSPLGIKLCIMIPRVPSTAPSPTIIPLFALCVSSGSVLVAIPVSGGISMPERLEIASIPAHAANIIIIIETVFAIFTSEFIQSVMGELAPCMLAPCNLSI